MNIRELLHSVVDVCFLISGGTLVIPNLTPEAHGYIVGAALVVGWVLNRYMSFTTSGTAKTKVIKEVSDA